jgi:hypothetical protein
VRAACAVAVLVVSLLVAQASGLQTHLCSAADRVEALQKEVRAMCVQRAHFRKEIEHYVEKVRCCVNYALVFAPRAVLWLLVVRSPSCRRHTWHRR